MQPFSIGQLPARRVREVSYFYLLTIVVSSARTLTAMRIQFEPGPFFQAPFSNGHSGFVAHRRQISQTGQMTRAERRHGELKQNHGKLLS